MSSDQVINQIIQTIVTLATEKTRNETIEQEKQSKLQNYQITDTLAAFMIRAIVLDPNYGFNAEKEMSREQVNRLIDVCVSKITSSDFEMETIRMQVYFDTNFPSQSDFLHREHMVHLEQCAGLLREIVQVKSKQIPSLEGTLF
jgi:tRNA G10  N-methylase Trm11